MFIFASAKSPILGVVNGLGSYIGHGLEYLRRRVTGGGLSTAAIIGSAVAASIMDSTVAASVVIYSRCLIGWH